MVRHAETPEGQQSQNSLELEEVAAWAAGLEAMHAQLAHHFMRPEPRRRALA